MSNNTEIDPNRRGRSDAKLRSNSKLGALTPEQRAKVDQWLFEENRSTREVATLCGTEFQAPMHWTSVGRYYRREKPLRDLKAEARRQMELNGKAGTEAEAEEEFRAILKAARSLALTSAAGEMTPERLRIFTACVALVISGRREHHEGLQAATTREKFEFDAVTACLLHQIEMEVIGQDASVTDKERLLAIRKLLFGPNLPK